MADSLSILSARVKSILKEEGLRPLLRRVLIFTLSRFYRYETFYLYEHTMEERKESDFMPKIPHFVFKVVASSQEAEELAEKGLNLSSHSIHAKKRLASGAIAFCILVGQDLAHIGWVALTEEAKKTFEPFPYRVDFASKEACTGGTVTAPTYEGNGLMTYGYYKRFEFLRENGITKSRNAVATTNRASQRVHAKFGPRIYARVRYLKLLWWQSWKEMPIAPPSRPG